jgi:hypothetical protein
VRDLTADCAALLLVRSIIGFEHKLDLNNEALQSIAIDM